MAKKSLLADAHAVLASSNKMESYRIQEWLLMKLVDEYPTHENKSAVETKVKLLTLCPGPFNSEFVSKAGNDYTFKKIKPIEASEVAAYGYKKSLQGKSIAIVGFKNKLTVFATRFAPRSFITKTSAKTMKKGA